jgi:hypothetical protein
LEETIRRAKCLYDQQKSRPTFQKAWEDKDKFKVDQMKKGYKPPFFRNYPQGQQTLKEPRTIDIGSQRPRQPPIQCWGCKGDYMLIDCPHRSDKGRTIRNVQQAKTMEDMDIKVPRIYVALDNKQAGYQSHMIEV